MVGIQTAIANGTNGTAKPSKPMLWTHPDPDFTRMADFMRGVNSRHGLSLKTYEELYQWSIDNIGEFWGEVWDFTGITAEKPYQEVCSNFITVTWLINSSLASFLHPRCLRGGRSLIILGHTQRRGDIPKA